MARKLRIIAIAAVLLFFFAVPLTFMAYGVLGGLLGGLFILAPIMVLQYMILKALQRVSDRTTRDCPSE